MNLQVAKWGNSLAVRIPADLVRRFGLNDGDQLQASLTVDGGLCLRHAAWDRKAFARQLDAAREEMALGESVMEELRRGARY
ncbi:AbrB/MazE/SpoVT family DNA-binding domain-containing protein [Noviherbaspirillum pedocola]|uniref:AbrB/MazE/SpoVT family DNA-binding domain-containing protein n=1 Tax=Noviherbaspirillum pedocola TaxID=2801341 RepID=A0A934T2H2_9BURK|nr:AbrB/MazE/SpoVT family DNA-binding domain-containing protein [Noviherbaspirillum pedocola]MBK4738242.1 AbrB/MazE/SpoVT family DNA-binding domain-containing protein [Noviherbaspirillum pedocola]